MYKRELIKKLEQTLVSAEEVREYKEKHGRTNEVFIAEIVDKLNEVIDFINEVHTN